MTCNHAESGCNYPEGECLGLCLTEKNLGYITVGYPTNTHLTCRLTGKKFNVVYSSAENTKYANATELGNCPTSEVSRNFIVGEIVADALKRNSMEALRNLLTPEEFRGYIKGITILKLSEGK